MIDLKGNTNFAALKNLQDEYVVPRTNLAAVDMDVANGLSIKGNTLYINLATAEDIEQGTTGSIIDPSVLKPILDGKQKTLAVTDGIDLTAGEETDTLSPTLTTVTNLIKDTNDVELVDVDAIRGAITAGQAVDVTSEPDNATNYSKINTFTVSGTYLGFASFPKYAPDLKYLLIATFYTNAATTASISGTWADGTTGSKSIAANTTTKLAMVFDSQSTGKITFGSSVTATVVLMREYEVTACTADAIKYIASLQNPDTWADYYLIKQDMVQPWTYIIPMNTSIYTTVAAGLAYQIDATTGTHHLTVDLCPKSYVGRDSFVRLLVGADGVIVADAPLKLVTPITANAINNCIVKYRDGEALLTVTDTLGGYVVTVDGGTDTGSLYAALTAGSAEAPYPYITISPVLTGSTINMGAVDTADSEKIVAGNGLDTNAIVGSINCTNKTTFTNIGLGDITVTGGNLTLTKAMVVSGSTVTTGIAGSTISLDGCYIEDGGKVAKGVGTLIPSSVSGNGGDLDFSGGNYIIPAGKPITIAGVKITGGTRTIEAGWGASATLRNCEITDNTQPLHGSAVSLLDLTSCYIHDNSLAARTIYFNNSASVNLTGCTVGDNETIRAVAAACSATFKGSNTMLGKFDPGAGYAKLDSGCTLDLTGNTNSGVTGIAPVVPGGGVLFSDEGMTTILTGATQGITEKVTQIQGGTVNRLANGQVTTDNPYGYVLVGGATYSPGTNVIGGSNAIIYLGGGNYPIVCSAAGSYNFSSCTITGATHTIGVTPVRVASGCTATLSNCVISGNSSPQATSGGGLFVTTGAKANIYDCTLLDNHVGTNNFPVDMMVEGAAYISGCTIHEVWCGANTPGGVTTAATVSLAGYNKIGARICQIRDSWSASIIVESGAILDWRGGVASYGYLANNAGWIYFQPGGATVYPIAANAEPYMLDNTALHRLGPTNVIDMNEQRGIAYLQQVTSFAKQRLSNCVISGGTGGGIKINNLGLEMIDCEVCGATNNAWNSVNALWLYPAPAGYTSPIVVSNTYVHDNVNQHYTAGCICYGATNITLTGCTITGNTARDAAPFEDLELQHQAVVHASDCVLGYCGVMEESELYLKGDCKVEGFIHTRGNSPTGHVIISGGATIDLTDNHDNYPINPGVDVTVYPDPAAPVAIIGYGGSATQTHEFYGGGTITGTAINISGAVMGATVTLPTSSCEIKFILDGQSAVSSAYIQASETPYVLDTYYGAGTMLVGTSTD